jgi:lipopolysaccharide biosynthesis glycosyltransferase
MNSKMKSKSNTIFPIKDNVLITLADSNYIDQAKQLFSSAYLNAGWDGDYLLLAHNIPEDKLDWFRNKGIYIYKCKPLMQENVGKCRHHSSAVLSKFCLFDIYFKKWKKIVFFDADIIIAGSLEELKSLEGFSARVDFGGKCLRAQISSQSYLNDLTAIGHRLFDNYDIESASFNSGVMVINTDIICNNSFDIVFSLWKEYMHLSLFGEQLIINLFMYGKWKPLPNRFNCYMLLGMQPRLFFKNNQDVAVFHFIGEKKVWNVDNPLMSVWKSNLARAEDIDLRYVLPAKPQRSKEEILNSEKNILAREKVLENRLTFDGSMCLLELDEYYAKNMMKEFRSLFLLTISKGYARGYIRYAPYFFVSYIPIKLKTRIKEIIFKSKLAL